MTGGDLDLAITGLLSLIANLQRVSAIIATARAAGRESLTPDEWAVILAAADAARAALPAAVVPTLNPAAGEPASSPPADLSDAGG